MYAKIQNGSVVEYPYGLNQLQRDNPNTSFVLPLTQDILDLSGMVEVVLTDAPEFDHTQTVVETPPQLVNGQWTQQWDVILSAKRLRRRLRGESYGFIGFRQHT